MTFSNGERLVTSWGYRCAKADCLNAAKAYRSVEAEKVHLWQRRFSRELIVRIGHRRFWEHQTMYEIHDWLTQDLHVQICAREVSNLMADFLALLSAAQPAKIRRSLNALKDLIIGVDGSRRKAMTACTSCVSFSAGSRCWPRTWKKAHSSQ